VAFGASARRVERFRLSRERTFDEPEARPQAEAKVEKLPWRKRSDRARQLLKPDAEKPLTPESPATEFRDVPSIRRFAAAEDARSLAQERSLREAECFFQRFG
jgi:hypothetical protein